LIERVLERGGVMERELAEESDAEAEGTQGRRGVMD
jgi:hypothetical protein